MVMTVKEFLEMYKPINGRVRPHVVLADGWIASIQATDEHYARRRGTEWTHVEIGYVRDEQGRGRLPTVLQPYQDGRNDENLFACVPIEVAQAFVDQHGGIVDVTAPVL